MGCLGEFVHMKTKMIQCPSEEMGWWCTYLRTLENTFILDHSTMLPNFSRVLWFSIVLASV